MRVVLALVDGKQIADLASVTWSDALHMALRYARECDVAVDVCGIDGELRVFPPAGHVQRMPEWRCGPRRNPLERMARAELQPAPVVRILAHPRYDRLGALARGLAHVSG